MRLVIGVGVCVAGPSWPKASRSWPRCLSSYLTHPASVPVFHARYLRFESLQSAAGILCQRVEIATQWLAIHCGVGPRLRPQSRWSCDCATKLGDPAMTRTCTCSASRGRRPSNPYLWLSAISVLGLAGLRARLRLPYRILLNEQKFVVIHAHVSELQLETVTKVHALHPANTDCPQCNGKGEVPQHGGLRQKTCTRCNGRGWIKTPSR